MAPDRRAFLAAGFSALAVPARAADYAATLSQAFGAPVDPLVAHRQATAAARACQVRADRLLRGQGLKAGSVAERLRALAADPRWLYADDDAGRDRAVAEMNARIEALQPQLAKVFAGVPIAEARVRRMSRADEAAGKGGYRQPEGYYVDLHAIRARPAWTLPSVAFHEVIPGHLLQMPLVRTPPRPEAQQTANVYTEAWGIYAEQLAADLGAYADDPRGEIGYLQWRLFRLGRTVVDTGVHALGWRRDRALAAMTELQGPSIAFITIEADVDRMIATPGRYAAEAMGALAFSAWRPRDRARWAAFHQAVLADGPAPFGELRRRFAAPDPFRA